MASTCADERQRRVAHLGRRVRRDRLHLEAAAARFLLEQLFW
jgi:hypothetical protein